MVLGFKVGLVAISLQFICCNARARARSFLRNFLSCVIFSPVDVLVLFSDKVFFSASNGFLALLSCVPVGGGALILCGAGEVLGDGFTIIFLLFSDVCNLLGIC